MRLGVRREGYGTQSKRSSYTKRNMAYNPTGFENVYGFGFLDEVHNFFPELLYDEGLFPNETLRWMRHRVNTLFPSAFVRQQHMYNLYSAEPRLRSYVQWHREHVHTPLLATPPPPRVTTAETAETPLGGAGVPHRRENLPQPLFPLDISGVRTRRVQPQTQMPALFTSLLWDIREPLGADFNDLFTTLNIPLVDVSIAPSGAQVESASSLQNASSIPEDVNCSICQERGDESLSWRVLHCRHMYHRECVDRWFVSHTQCPICRADVRTLQRPASQT